MSRTRATLNTILFVCFTLAMLGGLVWANVLYARSQPVEKNFLVPWMGARTFLQYGDTPYGEPATQRAQIVFYGKLASTSQDSLMLWLPLPVELLYFPIALIPDYALARGVWMACLEIALVLLGYFCLLLTGWKPGRIFLPFLLLFPLFWVFGTFSLVSGSAAGFISLAVAGFLLAMRSERDELAGGLLILLASATRLTGVLAFFVFLWIFFKRRWRILWGFLMGFAVLLGLSFLFIPDWILPSLRGLLLHLVFNPGYSTLGIFGSWSPVVGRRLGWLLAAGLVFVLFLEWRNTLAKDFRAFFWTACLTLAVTPLLGIPMFVTDYPFLALPLLLFLAILAERRPWLKRWGITGILLVIFLIGPWFLTIGLERANAYTALLNTWILLPPGLITIGLAWMRWWFLHPVPAGLAMPS